MEFAQAWTGSVAPPGLSGNWLLTGGSLTLTPGYCLAPLPGLVHVMFVTSLLDLRDESRRDNRK